MMDVLVYEGRGYPVSQGLISGSCVVAQEFAYATGTHSFQGLEELVTTGIEAEVYLICRGCGKKFLFQRENITAPLFEMSCTCGTMLEFEKEK